MVLVDLKISWLLEYLLLKIHNAFSDSSMIRILIFPSIYNKILSYLLLHGLMDLVLEALGCSF